MQAINRYKEWLIEEERSRNTVEKYIRDVSAFYWFLANDGETSSAVTKLTVMEYKEKLKENYSASSTNSMLVAINSFLKFMNLGDCCVKLLKIQRKAFRDESRELTKSEYLRLIETARQKRNERLCLLIEAICSTGIRVSELQYITVETARCGRAEINCKGKQRSIFIPKQLSRKLLQYASKNKISSGFIFRTKTGKAMDRSNIWHDMKALCKEAEIEESKVFPHNLRHLFARTFYGIEKDIVRLADILGHSSVDTTRIYMVSSGAEHARKVDRLGLVI